MFDYLLRVLGFETIALDQARQQYIEAGRPDVAKALSESATMSATTSATTVRECRQGDLFSFYVDAGEVARIVVGHLIESGEIDPRKIGPRPHNDRVPFSERRFKAKKHKQGFVFSYEEGRHAIQEKEDREETPGKEASQGQKETSKEETGQKETGQKERQAGEEKGGDAP